MEAAPLGVVEAELKAQVLARLRERIAADLAAVVESQRLSQAAATHPEARPEHAKDTRSTELSYLARGLADRVEQLEEAVGVLARLDPPVFGPETTIALGALVRLENEPGAQGDVAYYFLAPAGGGLEIDVEGCRVRVVTPRSPIGQGLVGRTEGDEIVIRTPSGPKTVEIAAVA